MAGTHRLLWRERTCCAALKGCCRHHRRESCWSDGRTGSSIAVERGPAGPKTITANDVGQVRIG